MKNILCVSLFRLVITLYCVEVCACEKPRDNSYYKRLSALVEYRIESNTINERIGYTERIGRYFFEYGMEGEFLSSDTPLYVSCSSDTFLPITKRLLRSGASPNHSSKDWARLPLLKAVENCAVKTVKQLLKAGANCSLPLYNQVTILHRICSDLRTCNRSHFKKNRRIIHLLLKYGADPNTQNINGYTPLYELCFTSKKARPIIILLLKYGADIFLTARNGKNAIELAGEFIASGNPTQGFSCEGLALLKDLAARKVQLKKKLR